jgi:hypothetical protein
MPRWPRLFELIGLNTIPIVGVFAQGWSASTALTLYWLESIAMAAFLMIRIALHRHWTRKRGHERQPLLQEVLVTSIPFSVAHGVFLGFFFFALNVAPDRHTVVQAAQLMLLVEGLTLAFDMRSLADWPLARLRERSELLFGRVALVHLTIIVGGAMLAYNGAPARALTVFVVLKALSDLGSLLPRNVAAGTDHAPPAWIAWIGRVFPKQNGETFEEYWRRTHAEAAAQRASDEEESPPRSPRRSRRSS